MQTFVVRTYTAGRNAVQDDGRLRGVVEEVSTGFRATFHDTSELVSILHGRRQPTSGERQPTPGASREGGKP
jgi:hypothetical protein